MLDNKFFWRSQHLFMLAFWGYIASQLLLGQSGGWLIKLAAVIAVLHVLEVPYALRLLRASKFGAGQVSLMTLLFGFTWWLPAKRGVFAPA
jgi:hypothetical protein